MRIQNQPATPPVTGNPRNPNPGGVASAKHQGFRRPNDDQRVEQALDDVGLDDRGDVLEDQLRDRRSSGMPPTEDLRSDRNDDERNERR